MKLTSLQSEALESVEDAPELVESNDKNDVEGDGAKHQKKKYVAKESKKLNNGSTTKTMTGEKASPNEKRPKRKRLSREEIAKARYNAPPLIYALYLKKKKKKTVVYVFSGS